MVVTLSTPCCCCRMEDGDLKLRVRVLESERAARRQGVLQKTQLQTIALFGFLNLGSNFAIQANAGPANLCLRRTSTAEQHTQCLRSHQMYFGVTVLCMFDYMGASITPMAGHAKAQHWQLHTPPTTKSGNITSSCLRLLGTAGYQRPHLAGNCYL